MTKRPDVSTVALNPKAAMQAAAQGIETAAPSPASAPAPKAKTKPAEPVKQPATAAVMTQVEAGGYKAPSRSGKRQVTLWFDPAVVKQLKQIALDEDTTIQALGAEAFNDLFAKRRKPRIAS
jgi:hypothetical protein